MSMASVSSRISRISSVGGGQLARRTRSATIRVVSAVGMTGEQP